MNFKHLILLLISLLSVKGFTQEVADTTSVFQPNWYKQTDPEVLYFSQSISKTIPFSNSSLKDYESLFSFSMFEIDFFTLPMITVGAYYEFGYGEVSPEKTDKLGFITGTRISNLGFQVGYYHAFTRRWNWTVKGGIAALSYRSHAYTSDNFPERGTSYKLDTQIAYRLGATWAFYFKVTPTYDKLNIKSTPDIQDYLNHHLKMDVGLGLRIHLHNPDG